MIDIIAGLIEVIAIVVVGNKNRWGWMIGFVCCVLWTIYVLINQTAYGILIPTIPCMIMNIYYFIKWSKT
jgi:nicotinamide riboside transporter PnuC